MWLISIEQDPGLMCCGLGNPLLLDCPFKGDQCDSMSFFQILVFTYFFL